MRSLADEVPFDIPDSWEWVRVRNCTELFNGRAFKPSDWAVMGLPIVRIQNLNDEKAPFNYYDKSVEEDVHLYGGELLFAWSGTPGTSFGAHIWRNQEAVLNQHIFKLLFDETALFKPYYMYALNQRVGSLIKAAHGSAGLQHVTRGVFESTLIPLPPFAEQIRIVEKLNVLFPIVDHYSSAYNNLNNLQSAFPEALKKSILQEGVQGKLVPQDPSDEPAEALLERIRAEKQRLIKEGKIKKDKHESVIFRRDNSHYEKRGSEEVCIDEELPFEIPSGWSWSRLGTCLDVRDGTHDTPRYVSEGVPLVTSKNLSNGRIDFSTAKLISREDSQAINQRSKVDSGDIMYAMIGSIGNPVLYQGTDEFSIKNMALFKNIPAGMYMEYVYWFLVLAQEDMRKAASGGVQAFVSLGYLRNYLIPVPPIAEQKRICDTIKQTLPLLAAL